MVRIETLLGPGATYKFMGHDMLSFDLRTENVEIIEGFRLHEFLTHSRIKKNTFVNVKLLAELDDIHKALGRKFGIVQTSFFKEHDMALFPEDRASTKWHWQGHAIDIVPLGKSYTENRELYKTVRRVKQKGAAIFHDTHIHLDIMNKKRVDLRTKRKPVSGFPEELV